MIMKSITVRNVCFIFNCTGAILLALVMIAAAPAQPSSEPPGHPGNSGVIRFADGMGFYFIDYQSGLMSFHGIQTPWAKLCAGSPPVFDPLDFQLIFTPTGTLHALITAQSHTVFVYPAVAFPNPNHIGLADCPILKNLVPLANGQARMTQTDNDIFGSDAPGADSFGLSSTGTLSDIHNDTITYSEDFRGMVLPDADEVVVVNLKIRLGQ
jgi:hypothetical protein